jgi:hypothetical protein
VTLEAGLWVLGRSMITLREFSKRKKAHRGSNPRASFGPAVDAALRGWKNRWQSNTPETIPR